MERTTNYNSLRNLPQFKGKTDEEIYEILQSKEQEGKQTKLSIANNLEERIQAKLTEFEQDYDISDLKYNDKEILRSMMIALISLEDLDKEYFELITTGIGSDNLNLLDKISSMSSKLRSDVSKMQDDLKISRKIRKSNKEESVISYLDDLKEKAKQFAESKMTWIFCPKCNMLLSTLWTLYPNEEQNVLILKCNRKLQNEDGENTDTCGEVVKVKLSDLAETKSNKPQIVPESIR